MPTVILRDKHAEHAFDLCDDDDGEAIEAARDEEDRRWQAGRIERQQAIYDRLVGETPMRDRRVPRVSRFLCEASGCTWEADTWDHWIRMGRMTLSIADAAGRRDPRT
jgi:hypothetical protein